ncbi:MAG: YraN family protein [Methylococcales bacterium]|nr:YraN family protein [Methylococcales bacterium]
MFNKQRPDHLIQGQIAEQQAYDYLLTQGLKLVCKNFNSRYGELDLIMKEGETLVIIEVRFRKNDHFGGALESITAKKKARIIKTTHYYLMTHPIDCPIRFDVITLSPKQGLNWIQNAFQCP